VARGDDAAVPEGGIFFNRVTGTAHAVKSKDDLRSCCGLYMDPLCYEFADHENALSGCSLCWRSGCSNWQSLPDEAVPVESNEEPIDAPWDQLVFPDE
jgi:hypothetical protein